MKPFIKDLTFRAEKKAESKPPSVSEIKQLLRFLKKEKKKETCFCHDFLYFSIL